MNCKKCNAMLPEGATKCPECGAWNTLQEAPVAEAAPQKALKQRGGIGSSAQLTKHIPFALIQGASVILPYWILSGGVRWMR